MAIKNTRSLFILLVLFIFMLTGCGGGGGGSSTPPAETSRDITGGGVKGPLANAVVTVYAFDASQPGFKGAVVATAATDNSAAITGLSLPLPLAPPYVMEFTSNASTTDITTGMAPVIGTLRTVITQTLLDTGEHLYATPLTTMAVDIAVANSNTTTTAAQFEAALALAAAQVVSTVGFGMPGDIDIFDVPPLVDDTTDTTAEQSAVAAYRSAVEALTAIVFQMEQHTSGAGVDAVLSELSIDLADGVIDGTVDGIPSTIFTSTTLDVLAQNPATLTIPNTTQTVADVQSILVAETATTGSTTSTTELGASGSIVTTTQAAETNPDSDGDGTLNANDSFPQDPGEAVDSDADGIGDNADTDDDNDGILDIDEGTTPAPTATDADGDGIEDSVDNCPANFNPAQTNTDLDANGDACDTDDDNDGTPDSADLFPLDAGEQSDADSDGTGDVADTDDDNDGLLDTDEDAATADPDGDGIPNREDTDSDNDGVLDSVDLDPYNNAITFNTAPVTSGDSVITNEDVAVAVVLNVSDDGVASALVYTITGPSNGVLSGTAPNLTYTPNADFFGSDSFSFSATDSGGAVSNSSTVTITVNALNDAPVIDQTGSLAVTMDEDGAPTAFVAPAITASDVDSAMLTWTGSAAASGTASVSGTGASPTITYAPNANFNGPDSFNVIVNDGSGGSDTITVDVTVNAQNDAPVATDDSDTTTVDISITTTSVLLNDSDVDIGDTLSVAAGNPTATNGTVVNNNDGTFTYTPNAGFIGADNFTYTVTDSILNDIGTVTITVNPLGNVAIISQLLDPAMGGGIGAWGTDTDSLVVLPQFEYEKLKYDVLTDTLFSEDMVYDYATQSFVPFTGDGDNLWLKADGSWVPDSQTVAVVLTANNGDGSMTASLQNSIDNAELVRLRLTARTIDISGVPIVNHLDADWAAEMIDPTAVFGADAQQVIDFTSEALVDSFEIEVDTSCEFTDPARFAALNSNCNGVSIMATNTLTTTLDQLISATPWFDPDTGSEVGLVAVFASFNATNSTVLMAEMVNAGNTVNYYVRDFSGTATAADRVTLVLSDLGGWVRDTTINNTDIIRLTVPASLSAQFPDLNVNEIDRRHSYVVHDGAVREGNLELAGEIDIDIDPSYNGIAIDQVLANFDPPPAPDITPLVGTWVAAIPSSNGDPTVIHIFANGYIEISGTCILDGSTGMSYGTFIWNDVTGAFSGNTLISTRGQCDVVGSAIGNTFTVNGDVLTLTLVGIGDVIYNRMLGTVNPVVGSWLRGDITAFGEGHAILTFLDDTTFTLSQNCVTESAAGFEYGIYSWDQGVTNALSGNVSIDTNGDCGLSESSISSSFLEWIMTVSADNLTLSIGVDNFNFTRHSN